MSDVPPPLTDEQRTALRAALYVLRNDLKFAESLADEFKTAIAVIERKLQG